jgi:hypothetical protein
MRPWPAALLSTVVLLLTVSGPWAGAATRPRAHVLVFFSSLCLSCRAETPQIKSWVAAHPQTPVTGVAFMEGLSTARPFAEQSGLSFPLVSDPSGALARRCRVDQPDAILVLRGNKVVTKTYLKAPPSP